LSGPEFGAAVPSSSRVGELRSDSSPFTRQTGTGLISALFDDSRVRSHGQKGNLAPGRKSGEELADPDSVRTVIESGPTKCALVIPHLDTARARERLHLNDLGSSHH
jgi:hypothetical protein